MANTQGLQRLLPVIAWLVIASPPFAAAQIRESSSQTSMQNGKLHDVALQRNGVLLGQAMDRQGRPLAGMVVAVRSSRAEVARITTDSRGRFGLQGLRGGVYELAFTGGSSAVRVWSHGTAPPSANPAAMLIQGEAVRGQSFAHGRPVLGHVSGIVQQYPILVGTGLAAALALPVALDDDDQYVTADPDSPPGPPAVPDNPPDSPPDTPDPPIDDNPAS